MRTNLSAGILYTMMIKRPNTKYMILILLLCIVSTFPACNTRAQSVRSNIEEADHTGNAGNSAVQVSSSEAAIPSEWPRFHGPDHQNKSAETGLMPSWPDDGPALLWTVSGLGEGYASVSIADGLVYTSGSIDDQTFVFAYNLKGDLVWKKPNGSAWDVEVYWATGYDGSRSTPTYDNGVVYHLSEAGRLAAYDAKNGDEIWSRNLMNDFEAQMPDYGFTESVVIEGEKLFVRPAGRKGFQVCLNKTTGELRWANHDIPGTYAYNSGVISELGGYRQLIGASSSCYYGMDTETGELLWQVNFENQYGVNCSDAVVVDEYVLLSSGEGGGSMLVRLSTSEIGMHAEKVWETDLMDNYHGGVIFHDGFFYGSGDRSRGWFSIDMRTGDQMWRSSGRMGSLTYAEGMLYLYDEKGLMSLVKAAPESFEKSGEFEVPNGGVGPYWAHPVVCGGRLYLRHANMLFVYDIDSNAE